jgi:predicted PurR-regulated permease PerM
MLGIDRRVLKAAWTLFLFALALAAIYFTGRTLILFLLALFLAHLLSPVVDRVQRFLPRRGRRIASLAIVYLALAGILASIAIPVGSKIGEQAAILAAKLPGALQADPLGRLPLPVWLEPQRAALNQFVRDRVAQLGEGVLPTLSSAGRQILSGLGSLLSVLLIPILSFLFLKDGRELRLAFVDLFDEGSRPLVEGILADLHFLLTHYIRALILLALATFLSFSAFLSAVAAPYAILLAGIAAALEVIPVLGPLAAAISILAVAALSGFPHLLWLIVFLVVYRLFQDYVLNPYLMSAGVEVPPLLVLFGVLAGEQVAGIPGMFFSVPAIAALRVVLGRLRRHAN